MSSGVRVPVDMTLKRFLVLTPGRHHPITVEPNLAQVRVILDGRQIASSSQSLTLREAGYPPVHYFPFEHVDGDVLVESRHSTYCPFKGDASYYSLRVEDTTVADAVWTYRAPHDAVAPIAGYLAFRPNAVDHIEVVDAG